MKLYVCPRFEGKIAGKKIPRSSPSIMILYVSPLIGILQWDPEHLAQEVVTTTYID
jgi:hypothetical protein